MRKSNKIFIISVLGSAMLLSGCSSPVNDNNNQSSETTTFVEPSEGEQTIQNLDKIYADSVEKMNSEGTVEIMKFTDGNESTLLYNPTISTNIAVSYSNSIKEAVPTSNANVALMGFLKNVVETQFDTSSMSAENNDKGVFTLNAEMQGQNYKIVIETSNNLITGYKIFIPNTDDISIESKIQYGNFSKEQTEVLNLYKDYVFPEENSGEQIDEPVLVE